jgi:hypothetical protein
VSKISKVTISNKKLRNRIKNRIGWKLYLNHQKQIKQLKVQHKCIEIDKAEKKLQGEKLERQEVILKVIQLVYNPIKLQHWIYKMIEDQKSKEE